MKSSKLDSLTLIRCFLMKSAPSRALSTRFLIAHSHSRTPRKLGDLNAVLLAGSDQLLAVVDAVGGLLEIDEPAVPGRNLHAFVTEFRRLGADRVECIERRLVAGELSEEDRGSLDRFHGRSSFSG